MTPHKFAVRYVKSLGHFFHCISRVGYYMEFGAMRISQQMQKHTQELGAELVLVLFCKNLT